MAKLKGCKIAQQGHAGGEDNVYDATAAIAASEAASQYSRIPTSLKAKRIWLPFKTSPRPAGGVNKIPYNRQGRPAKHNDPSTWMSYAEAVQQAQRPGFGGIGIMLHAELGIMGIDFDHCVTDGVIDPEVEGWVAALGTYTELSFSGDGLHALAFGRLPWKANRNSKVEMYVTGRYFVVTGRQMTGTPDQVMPGQAGIDQIHAQVFGNQPVTERDTTTPSYTGREERGEGAESLFPDEEVMAALLRAQQSRKYFVGAPVAVDASRADWDLARSLAFFCHGNVEQMRRLFLKSVLVRPKTSSKRGATDYLGITLHKAAARQASKGVYWLPKVRNSTPNSREGRPLSAVTVAVLTMHAAQPELRLVAIAAQLGIDAAHVRQIVRRGRKATPPSLLSVVERSCDTLPEPVIAKEEPTKEELMSCPRRYRADYAKPKGWVDIPYKPILADGVTYESNYVLPPRRKPPIRSFNIKRPLPVNMRRVA
jgi:hypothetical protein